MILKNGTEVHDGAYVTTKIAVDTLSREHPEHIFALVLLASDPTWVLSENSVQAIKSVGLLTESGKLHDVTRDIVLDMLT